MPAILWQEPLGPFQGTDGPFFEPARSMETTYAVTNPKRAQAVEIRRAGDDVLVHDLNHNKVHVLNGTAGYVLEQCDGTRSASEIAHALSDSTGADVAIVAGHIDDVLRRFEALQLLEDA